MAQISDNLREGPDHACLDDCQRALAALARAPTEIERVTGVLFSMWQRMLTGTGGRDQRWDKFERCFGVSGPHILQYSEFIRNTYLSAGRVLSSSRCLISRMTDPDVGATDPQVWGFSPHPPDFHPAAGFDYEIQLGLAFLDDTSTAYNPSVQRCGLFHVRDQELLRVTTLVHEAIHWVNGAGHDELSLLFSPNSYELFMLDTTCSFPPELFYTIWRRGLPPTPNLRLRLPGILTPPGHHAPTLQTPGPLSPIDGRPPPRPSARI